MGRGLTNFPGALHLDKLQPNDQKNHQHCSHHHGITRPLKEVELFSNVSACYSKIQKLEKKGIRRSALNGDYENLGLQNNCNKALHNSRRHGELLPIKCLMLIKAGISVFNQSYDRMELHF